MAWDPVALYVFEVKLSPEWSVVAQASPEVLVGGSVRCWIKVSICEDVVDLPSGFVSGVSCEHLFVLRVAVFSNVV